MDKLDKMRSNLEKNLPVKKAEPPINKDKKDIKDDYEFSRETYRDLIKTGTHSLDSLAELARESEHPRAFEVLSRSIKDIADTTEKLMALQKSKKDLAKEDEEKEEKEDGSNTTVVNKIYNGAVFDALNQIETEIMRSLSLCFQREKKLFSSMISLKTFEQQQAEQERLEREAALSGIAPEEGDAKKKKKAKKADIPLGKPLRDWTPAQLDWLIEGDELGYPKGWWGIRSWFGWMESRAYKMHVRVFLSRYRKYERCTACAGTRLKPEALAWKIEGKSVPELYAMPASEALRFLQSQAPCFEDDAGAYDQKDAEGFIKLNALRMRIAGKQ